MFGNMLVLGDIEILEHWGQMDSLNLNAFLVFLEDVLNSSDFLWSHVEVLSSSIDGIVNSYSCYFLGWILLNTI